jgi:hypothetical protein
LNRLTTSLVHRATGRLTTIGPSLAPAPIGGTVISTALTSRPSSVRRSRALTTTMVSGSSAGAASW